MSLDKAGSLALALLLGIAVGNGEAKQPKSVPLHGNYSSSTGVLIPLDTNDDNFGSFASWGDWNDDRIGNQTYHAECEIGTFVIPSVSCAPSSLELTLAQCRSIVIIKGTGAQIFSKLTSGYLCIDPQTGNNTSRQTWEVVGGTGAYAQASGTFESRGSFITLASDARGNSWGSDTGTFAGDLVIP